jgi:hypothetical protein
MSIAIDQNHDKNYCNSRTTVGRMNSASRAIIQDARIKSKDQRRQDIDLLIVGYADSSMDRLVESVVKQYRTQEEVTMSPEDNPREVMAKMKKLYTKDEFKSLVTHLLSSHFQDNILLSLPLHFLICSK